MKERFNVKERFNEFSQISFNRDDLEASGFDGSAVDDDTMRWIAEKLADAFYEKMFRSSLKTIGEELNIPRLISDK